MRLLQFCILHTHLKIVHHMLQLVRTSVSVHTAAIAVVQVKAHIAIVCIADVTNAKALQLGVDYHRAHGQATAHQIAHDGQHQNGDRDKVDWMYASSASTAIRCAQQQHVDGILGSNFGFSITIWEHVRVSFVAQVTAVDRGERSVLPVHLRGCLLTQ